MMSISTTSTSGVLLQHLDAVAAVLGEEHLHLVALEHAGQREDVAHVVVDDQHLLAGEHRVGLVRSASASAACVSGRFASHAVQEERGLVEQPLGRLDAP